MENENTRETQAKSTKYKIFGQNGTVSFQGKFKNEK